MTGVRFAIADWAAVAPGLAARSDWQAWARSPWPPEGTLEARVEAMPAMQRRRLNALGRAAAQVAWECHASAGGSPVVFASGHGDAQRCLHLLKEFAASGAASPTDFALSVHNAIGAMYSITRGDRANYSSVAGGPASAAAGVVEACALLADGAPEVLLVCYDAPLPGEYAAFQREPAAAYAWAWRIVAAPEHGPHLSLAWQPGGEDDTGALPFGLEALRFAVGDSAASRASRAGTCWTWSRHG
jgi:hypothetical protein